MPFQTFFPQHSLVVRCEGFRAFFKFDPHCFALAVNTLLKFSEATVFCVKGDMHKPQWSMQKKKKDASCVCQYSPQYKNDSELKVWFSQMVHGHLHHYHILEKIVFFTSLAQFFWSRCWNKKIRWSKCSFFLSFSVLSDVFLVISVVVGVSETQRIGYQCTTLMISFWMSTFVAECLELFQILFI